MRACALLAGLLFALIMRAQPAGTFAADVVIIVDTSASMSQPGMDPERASLLVAKLFTDIVPGQLAVIRLLDLEKDKALVPTQPTGKMGPCEDSPGTCPIVAITDETLRQVREKKAGAEIRPSLGSEDFKRKLDTHLLQQSQNSGFHLSFMVAKQILDEHKRSAPDVPQTVIWLSDGDVPAGIAEGAGALAEDLMRSGADLRAVVFGRGKTAFAEQHHIPVHRASSPAELVTAFTSDFRHIVRAPYENPGSSPEQPFEMKRQIDEAWVIVYGDRTLGSVAVDGPSGSTASEREDMFPSAGAYKVVHLLRPAGGQYRVRVTGGGPKVMYGVVERSSLGPELLEPRDAITGIAAPLVVGLRASGGPDVPASEIGEPVKVTAEIEGRSIELHDDGRDGDQAAGDGRYSAMAVFNNAGDAQVKLLAINSFLNRAGGGTVHVSGSYRCPGCEITLDFGNRKAGAPACLPLQLPGEHLGVVPFELRLLHGLPSGYEIEIRTAGGSQHPGGAPVRLGPGQAASLCLVTSRSAGSSRVSGDRVGSIAMAGGGGPDAQAGLRLSWDVHALSFWERWGWLVLLILGVLLVVFIIYGYIKPYRFAPELAVSYAPEYSDLDDQIPQPIKQWRDVGIGFYRNAWACLQPDFRISRKTRNALAILRAAARRSSLVFPANGHSLFRQTSEGDWEPVPLTGQRVQAGDVYRVGDQGPHFRVTARLIK